MAENVPSPLYARPIVSILALPDFGEKDKPPNRLCLRVVYQEGDHIDLRVEQRIAADLLTRLEGIQRDRGA